MIFYTNKRMTKKVKVKFPLKSGGTIEFPATRIWTKRIKVNFAKQDDGE